AKDAATGFLVTMVWNQDVKYPGAQNLYSRLKKALGGEEPSQHAAQSYAGMLAAAEAIRLAGSADPARVQEALKRVKLNTAFGPVSFRSYGGYQNQNSVVGLITQVQNGKFVTVAPATAATGKIVFPRK
ncbi:branched-chain amino acid ABC transporter substrate-binding protein, partial [Deinococcus cavernae]